MPRCPRYMTRGTSRAYPRGFSSRGLSMTFALRTTLRRASRTAASLSLLLSLSVAACGGATSGAGSTADSACVATPALGAACEPGIPACGAYSVLCGPEWTCDSLTRQWVEGSHCAVEPPVCVVPSKGGACSPEVPACPASDGGACAPIVTWTCDGTSDQWQESVSASKCVVDDGGMPSDATPDR
jgi:hypothetical protein